MKIKDLIKELEKLDGEKTIGIWDDEEYAVVANLEIEENEATKKITDYVLENKDR